ncbi:MAG: hypothetical protein NVS3B25_15290 [Hymenobacter sp.]
MQYFQFVLRTTSAGRALARGIRSVQTLWNYRAFQRLQQLTARLPLAPLLARQPRFLYKHLAPYIAARFSPATRLAVQLHHWQYLATTVRTAFFAALPSPLVLWRDGGGEDAFAITLSYPERNGFECALALTYWLNDTPLQMVGFVLAPGAAVGEAPGPVLLLSQVQGLNNPALLKHATQALHDITPAALLIQAAYGLATALGIGQALGISTQEQLCQGAGSYFDYDGFWQHLAGERTAQDFYRLAIPAPEKPLERIKRNHRARTRRKRAYKRGVREGVEQYFRAAFVGGEAPGTPGPEGMRLPGE